MHLLTSLRQLATGGRAVITTIHQPSSRLFQQLDKLLLLSKGCVLVRCRVRVAKPRRTSAGMVVAPLHPNCWAESC